MSDDAPRMTSYRPYLLRALAEWINDNGMTPHILVDAGVAGVRVPPGAVREGKVVLNIADRAVVGLSIDNEWIEFTARFGGVSQPVSVPVGAVLAVYARETGQGMGPTLNTAAGMGAYALTDRGTWLAFENKGDLEIVVEGDKRLFNQYGVMLTNPAKHPHVKAADGQAFVDWLISAAGQQAIADFKIDGQQLFFPNYQPAS